MKTRSFDVAVIGAGSAGLTAFRAASEQTDSVVLIEGGPYGTTCARVGCMPSKLLIAAAEAAHSVDQAPGFGINVGDVRIDGRAVMDRVRRERDRFVGFVVDGVESIPPEQRIRGYAKFIDDHHVQINDHTVVEAQRFVIATGSSPSYPHAWNDLGDRLVVNDDIFDWTELPRSVAVFGPGVIGLELGQALSRLGVEVSMFGKGGGVGPLTDPKVADSARRSFAAAFHFNGDAQVVRIELFGFDHEDKKILLERIKEIGYIKWRCRSRANGTCKARRVDRIRRRVGRTHADRRRLRRGRNGAHAECVHVRTRQHESPARRSRHPCLRQRDNARRRIACFHRR